LRHLELEGASPRRCHDRIVAREGSSREGIAWHLRQDAVVIDAPTHEYQVQRRNQMKLIAFALVGVATLAGVVAFTAPAANQEGTPIFVTNIPPGYRDWRLIAHST
jgi:hypothetical protein